MEEKEILVSEPEAETTEQEKLEEGVTKGLSDEIIENINENKR